MHDLLLIGGLIFLLYTMPWSVTLSFVAGLLFVCALIRWVTRAVAGVTPTFPEALRGMAFSVGLIFLIFTLWISYASGTSYSIGFSIGTGPATRSVMAMSAAVVASLASYVLGFKWGLGLSTGASVIVACVATAASAGFYWLQRAWF